MDPIQALLGVCYKKAVLESRSDEAVADIRAAVEAHPELRPDLESLLARSSANIRGRCFITDTHAKLIQAALT